MARYDRVNTLDAPARDASLPGWSVLRDLEGRDRETDLARRARLAWLAARLLHRVARHRAVQPGDSIVQHAAAVREEIAALPQRDAERARLVQILDQVVLPQRDSAAAAAHAYAGFLVEAGRFFAAEEFARLGEELGAGSGTPDAYASLRVLMVAALRTGRFSDADHHAGAAAVAAGAEERHRWGSAMAHVFDAVRMDAAAAGHVVAIVDARALSWGDDHCRGIAAYLRARRAFDGDRIDEAATEAWRAWELIADRELRRAALDLTARALLALGLHDAADHGFLLLHGSAGSALERSRAALGRACVAAAQGAAEQFRLYAAEARAEIGSPALRPSAGPLLLELGRTALGLGLMDDAAALATSARAATRSGTAMAERADALLGEATAARGRIVAFPLPTASRAGNDVLDVARQLLLTPPASAT
jgi:hypothetical protein